MPVCWMKYIYASFQPVSAVGVLAHIKARILNTDFKDRRASDHRKLKQFASPH